MVCCFPVPFHIGEKFIQKIPNPDPDPDDLQNLMATSLDILKNFREYPISSFF